MLNIAIIQARLRYFDGKLKIFNKYNKFYNSENFSRKQNWEFFRAIDGVFAYYWRYIRKYYKLQNIKLKSPKEVYLRAKTDGLINDADCWLEYIEDLNVLYNINEPKLKYEKLLEFIEYYRNKIPLILECMHSKENMALAKENEPVYKEYLAKKIVLADNVPVYSKDELDITQRSYDILLSYFKEKPQIKNVWLHGSRYEKKHTELSDIDLIIDCPAQYMSEIVEGFEKLDIPYTCDISNLNIPKDAFLIKVTMSKGTKKIYRAEDFYDNVENNSTSKPKIPQWLAFYRNTWLKNFSDTGKLLSEGIPEEDICDAFISLYDYTYELLKLFLCGSGMFINNMNTIIKYMHTVKYIDNIEQWFNFQEKLYKLRNNKAKKQEMYGISEYYKLFEDLNIFLEKQV